MRKKIILCVLFLVSSKCDSHQPGHPPSLLGGLLSGAHELGTKVNNVLGGLAQGALNLEGHIEVNRVQGYQPRPPPPPLHNGGYRPGKPTETIIVVVETDGRPNHHHDHDYHDHHHNHDHGHGGHRPPPQGHGPPYHDQPNYPNRPGYGYRPQNNEWNDNNYNKPQNNRPGYGSHNQGQTNFNGNPYTNNNGNFGQNNYGRLPSNDNVNQNDGSEASSYDNGNFDKNNPESLPPNTGNYNNNNGNPPSENFDQSYQTKPPVFNSGNNENQYGNIPNKPPTFDKPEDGFPEQNNPGPVFTTKQPEKNTQYGSIYDVNKENANNIPTRKPDYNVNNEHTTKTPDDDAPLFVPLNPGEYHYGGDKIDVNAPKRETNPNPVEEDDSESYPIDVRFGDQ